MKRFPMSNIYIKQSSQTFLISKLFTTMFDKCKTFESFSIDLISMGAILNEYNQHILQAKHKLKNDNVWHKI